MGLPIWRDPDETKTVKPSIPADPIAASRSSIRRRPSIHGRRPGRPRLTRDSTVLSPRFERPSPPSVGSHGVRASRRHTSGRVPPISTWIDRDSSHRADPAAPLPPPPVPESRNYYEDASTLAAQERNLRSSVTELQDRATQSERHTHAMGANAMASIDDVESSRVSLAAQLRTRMYEAQARIRATQRRLPEPARASAVNPDRPQSRDGSGAHRSALPTPPLDASEHSDSLFVPEPIPRPSRGLHPLRRSWRADSPVDGLGDRNRSPTPADGWEIMRSTITPDATLPSADSSFTSAAASQSFTSNQDTNITEPEPMSSGDHSRRNSIDDSNSDSISSVDPDDLVCTEDDEDMVAATEAFAEDMYYHETRSAEGRQRISEQQEIRNQEGNRFALAHEPDRVDIGFRLIEDALDSEEGRERVMQLQENAPENVRMFERAVQAGRRPGRRRSARRRVRSRRSHLDLPVSPHPERYGEGTRVAAREATEQIHDYFRRFTADALAARRTTTSPPPRYEPPEVSQDGPEPHPVSPPSRRSELEASEALLSGDETDLGAMRRVVERLASRDDVPDEWWTSIGLNLSRTRPQDRSPPRAAGRRVRSGRIERGNPRL